MTLFISAKLASLSAESASERYSVAGGPNARYAEQVTGLCKAREMRKPGGTVVVAVTGRE